MVQRFAAEVGRDLSGFHWGLNQPTAISLDAAVAMDLAISNVGQRYVTEERSAKDIAQALCIVGTPIDCIKAVEERIFAGVEHINLGFLASEPDAFFNQMQLFASHVMPYFQ
jgi:alkanesulfonate monooxygenase SsuD/methylene tetrahydromethanopterin reductase-like flavin-dependent oxidoreductase (luciferase family)